MKYIYTDSKDPIWVMAAQRAKLPSCSGGTLVPHQNIHILAGFLHHPFAGLSETY